MCMVQKDKDELMAAHDAAMKAQRAHSTAFYPITVAITAKELMKAEKKFNDMVKVL